MPNDPQRAAYQLGTDRAGLIDEHGIRGADEVGKADLLGAEHQVRECIRVQPGRFQALDDVAGDRLGIVPAAVQRERDGLARQRTCATSARAWPTHRSWSFQSGAYSASVAPGRFSTMCGTAEARQRKVLAGQAAERLFGAARDASQV